MTNPSDIDQPHTHTSATRRGFLVGGGAAGAALLIAACGSSTTPGASNSNSNSSAPASSSGSNDDLATAMVAASLEVLAVKTYAAALDAAQANKLGAVPPAVANFIGTAKTQHQAALDKWNSVLTGAGQQAVSSPPSDLNATVQQAFGQVTDVTGAAKLALLLEQTAADTYLKAVSSLQGKDAIQLAGSIQVIDQQHAAILLYVLGQYPVPDVFQTGAKAYAGTGASSSAASPSAT